MTGSLIEGNRFAIIFHIMTVKLTNTAVFLSIAVNDLDNLIFGFGYIRVKLVIKRLQGKLPNILGFINIFNRDGVWYGVHIGRAFLHIKAVWIDSRSTFLRHLETVYKILMISTHNCVNTHHSASLVARYLESKANLLCPIPLAQRPHARQTTDSDYTRISYRQHNTT